MTGPSAVASGPSSAGEVEDDSTRVHVLWCVTGQEFRPEVVEAALAGIVAPHAHRWSPEGLSLIGWTDDLHLVLHTWPEHGRATLDVVVRRGLDPERIARQVCHRLDWKPLIRKVIHR